MWSTFVAICSHGDTREVRPEELKNLRQVLDGVLIDGPKAVGKTETATQASIAERGL